MSMPAVKLALELGPLVIFFVLNGWLGKYYPPADAIYYATGPFMMAIAAALGASWLLNRKVPVMPVVTGAFVMIFGGLTLWLHDATFIMMKPTIVNVLFAGALGGGLLSGHSLIKIVLSEAIKLQEQGWRLLTIRWAFFFLFLAILNEIVWRVFPAWWVTFKAFGIMPITFLFMMGQIGLLQRYQVHD
jgi:intracellular septation protein